MNRRHLMKTLGIAGVTLSSQKIFSNTQMDNSVLDTENEATRDQKKLNIPVWQTSTNENETLLVVIGPAKENLKFFASEQGTETTPNFTVESFQLFAEQEKVYHLHFTGLKPKTEYQISARNESGTMSTNRRFKTLSRSASRYATMSCSNFLLYSEKIWQKVENEKPDFIIYMGDSVYSDTATNSLFKTPSKPDVAYERYITTLRTLRLYHQQTLVPIFNIWDDHDFGWNNGDARHPYKDYMQKMFRLFFPQRAGFELSLGPGVSFAETLGNVRYIFTDDRSFRSYDAASNQLFGPEQRTWILSQLMWADGPAVLICGSQFFGFDRSSDSVSDSHPNDFLWLMKVLETFKHPVFFMDGDVHYSRLERLSTNYIGYETFQLTSSAIHSVSAANTKKRGVPSELGYYGYNNFNFVEIKSATSSQIGFAMKCISEDRIEYQYDLKVVR